jgi:hypothetical protein
MLVRSQTIFSGLDTWPCPLPLRLRRRRGERSECLTAPLPSGRGSYAPSYWRQWSL